MKAFIKAISIYLPEKVITNQDIAERFPEWSIEKVASKIGINQRHIASDDEFVSDMAVRASKNLFSQHEIKPGEIDFILLCTQSPDYFLPTTACLVQNRLGIPNSAGAIDFNLGCSGYVYGLAMAKGLIAGGIAHNILLITSETYSKHIHKLDKGNTAIFGDASTATLISTEGFAEILEFELGTDGSGAGNLIVKQGGLRYPNKKNDKKILDDSDIEWSRFLYMNGPEIFNFTIKHIPDLVYNILNKNKIKKQNIELFIFHQANAFILNHLRRKLDIEPAKFFIDMSDYGNTVSSTIPIAIHDATKQEKLTYGSNALLAGFGVGYSWGGCVIRF